MSWYDNEYRKLPTSKDIEYAVGFVLGAGIVHDKAEQLKDIDLRKGDETVSVKFQRRAADTGNLSFEMLSINTRTGETTEGNFPKCKAKFVAIVVPVPESLGTYTIYGFLTASLHEFVKTNAHDKKRLTRERLEANADRKYNDAESWLVKAKDIAAIARIHYFRFDELERNPAFIKYCIDNRYGQTLRRAS